MSVFPFPAQGNVPSNATSLQFKLEMYQRALREWAPALDPFEFATAMRLLDRTVGWGESATRDSASKLQAGLPVMGRTKFYEALASLEGKGLIARRGNAAKGERISYSINPGWTPDMAFNVPMRLRDLSATRTPPVRHADTPVRHADTIDRYSSTNTSLTDTVPEQAGHSGQYPVKKVREIGEMVPPPPRARGVAKAIRTNGSDRSAGVEVAWRAALIEAFPALGHAPWDHRQRANVKRAAQAWLNANQISFEDFATWAVTNWTAIISKQFRWMKEKTPPATPTINFFLHFIPQFAECWAESKLNDWLSDSERTELEQLMGRGMAHEQALTEIGTRNAVKALRKETDEMRRDAAAKLARASQAVEQARKLAEVRGAIHPRSRARLGKPKIEAPRMEIGDHDFGCVPLLDPDRNPFDEG